VFTIAISDIPYEESEILYEGILFQISDNKFSIIVCYECGYKVVIFQ
jgi:predicted nucleic-acid-binding Zn-ribbon protein